MSSGSKSSICIAALYHFTPFEDCGRLRVPLGELCSSLGIKGTLLLAREGINGTIAGDDTGIAVALAHIRSLPGCAGLDVKFSRSETMPFHRMKVRIKSEIVTMGKPDIDPLAAGLYIAPEDWNALIVSENTIVIDTRNDYEVAIGSFAGAIDPGIATFRDFPAWFHAHRDKLLGDGASTKIAMFCTGGIRCEKATAFLKSEGLDEVYHLKGGILRYLETVPVGESRWEGECFVFDQRVAVTHGLAQGNHELCHACRRPVTNAERTLPPYVAGVSCATCYGERTAAQREGYAERMRQTRLAQTRGVSHVGAVISSGLGKHQPRHDIAPKWFDPI